MSYACAPSWMDEPRQIRIGARGGRLASRTPWNIYALVAVLAAVNRHAERFTDMTDAIIVTVDSVRSRASTQETLLTLAVPQEHAPMIAKFLGMIHQNVAVAFAEVEGGKPSAKKEDKDAKPYGKEAAELYRLGWFFNQKVLEAIGTDEEYLAWIEKQECCATALLSVGTRIKADGLGCASEETRFVDHIGDVVAAHVRRIANGAGTGIKPPYSAIPLCHGHHDLQHQAGESAIGGKVWCDEQRNKHLVDWASHKLANTLGHPSMGFVPPNALREWAMRFELLQHLPQVYRA